MATAPLPAIITPPREPLVDPRTGQIARTWFLFLQQLQRNTSGLTDSMVLTADDETQAFPGSLQLVPAAGQLERLLATGTFTLGLANTAVAAATYGDASHTVSITFDAKGRATGASSIALSTSNITEGSKLFYTDARARAAISGVSPISYNPGTGAISHATSPAAGTYTTLSSITIDATGHVSAFTP